MNLHVDITRDEIRRGRFRSACFCPVALAVEKSAGKAALFVSVDGEEVTVFGRDDVKVAHLSAVVCDWVKAFDSHGDVMPISFELEFVVSAVPPND